MPTYSQKDVEKVRAIVAPTYASGSNGMLLRDKDEFVILMKNVSNLFHHIHFEGLID